MAERWFVSRFGRRWNFTDKQRAYRLTFNQSHASNQVMADLCDFCRGLESTFHEDPRMHAYNQGKQDVWRRIVQHLKLTEEQYMAVLQGRLLTPPTEGEE